LFVDLNTNKLFFLNSNLKEKHFYLALLNRLILGVLKGFSIKLNIVGVGYKAFLDKNMLILKLGFSHHVLYAIPNDIKIKVISQKGLSLHIFGNDFQKVTQVAAEIRGLKPAEPYKGKGIQYSTEIVKRKEGKKTNV
jgi:large subunit ribosomal protein L6